MAAGPLDMRISERVPLRESVYRRLKQAIVEGQFGPGQRLVETDLASRLGVSRNPVREALRMLEQEHLVLASTQGLVVSSITRSRIQEVYSLRAILEAEGCRLAAMNATPEERARFRDLLECAAEALANHDMLAMGACDTDFHNLLMHASRNETLELLLDQLHDHILRFRHVTLNIPGRPEDVLHDHTAIADAVIRGDADAAASLVNAHLTDAVRRLLQHLDRLENP